MARLHHSVFRRNIVHKPNGHEQKHRKLRHPFCRHKGNILQHLHRGLFLCLCEADIFRQLAGDKILFFYHNERADRDFRLGAAFAQNRRDKACEPHRTKIDILAAEALGLRHTVDMRLHAPVVRGACGGAHAAALAAVPVFIKSPAGFVGQRAAQTCGLGKGLCTFPRQPAVELLVFHLRSRLSPCAAFLSFIIQFFVWNINNIKAKKSQRQHLPAAPHPLYTV